MARWVSCRDIFSRRTRNRRLLGTRVPLAKDVDAAVRAVAVVLAKAGDGVVRAADAALAKVGAAHAKADGDHAKVGAARARAAEAHARADVDRGEASRRVIRRLLRNRSTLFMGHQGCPALTLLVRHPPTSPNRLIRRVRILWNFSASAGNHRPDAGLRGP